MEPARLKALVLKRRLLEALLSANASEAALTYKQEPNKNLQQLFVESRAIMAEYMAVVEEIENA